MTRIEEIAGKLTKAQREAMLTAVERGREYRVPGFELRNERCLDKLVRAGLATSPSWNRGNRLTPLGLAVRDRLMKEQGE